MYSKVSVIFVLVFSLQLNLSHGWRGKGRGFEGANSTTIEESDGGGNRQGKIFSLFGIVRFPNDVCRAGTQNGTCYTREECRSRGGDNGGTCAQGFGVCCVFTLGCGGTSRENCTYFSASGPQSGACQATICPCGNHVCQLRLDFESFQIAGPSTVSTSVARALFGVAVATVSQGVSVSQVSQCLTDTFAVSNPGGKAPPAICGLNTGEHMYVDSSDMCNDLTFQLGNSGVGTAIPARTWNIKVTQYNCGYRNLAPPGCTQYFFGSNTAQVQTYNYDGGQHLASQDQSICVRRERGNCRICWTAVNPTDFQLSGTTSLGPITTQTACCSFGRSGTNIFGYDCFTLQGALTTANSMTPAPSRICGRSMGLATSLLAGPMTVCSRQTPFNVRFLSDQYEFTGFGGSESEILNSGFRLVYIQDGTNC